MHWCLYFIACVLLGSKFVIKSAHLDVTMPSKVHILVPVCLQKYISLYKYVLKSEHLGGGIILTKGLIFHNNWPHPNLGHLGVTMD